MDDRRQPLAVLTSGCRGWTRADDYAALRE